MRSAIGRWSASSVSEPAEARRRRRAESGALYSSMAMRIARSVTEGAGGERRRYFGMDVSQPGDSSEREADAVADEASRSGADPFSFLHERFGHDFGGVRIHTDGAAAEISHDLHARAFTVGNDIYFSTGSYAPESEGGRRLLAHELTHTVQQANSPSIQRAPVPGWNFTPADFAKLNGAGNKLTIAGDSTWFPANCQDNLLKTLAFLLGSKASPAVTEGVNAMDLFHGHLVIKKDPATAKQTATAVAQGGAYEKDIKKERKAALGNIRFDPKGFTMTPAKIAAYDKALKKVEPSLAKVLDDSSKVPGATLMYHTYEFAQPSDVKAKIEACTQDTIKEADDPSILERRRHGVRPISDEVQGSFNTICNQPIEKMKSDDPRRYWITPLATNTPEPSTRAAMSTFTDYIVSFVFLVDTTGQVHVRPLTADTGFTTLELSTITGTAFPEPLTNE